MSQSDKTFDRYSAERIAADILNKTGWIIGTEFREEVVRCRDCRKWATEKRFTGYCLGPNGAYDPDGFCSLGERKGDR